MAKAFRIGHPLDVRQNRLEILDEDEDVSCAIEDIEVDDADDDDDEPMLLIEDSEEGDGVALTQNDLAQIWPYLEAFRKNGTIGLPKIDMDRADHISCSQEDGSAYIHFSIGGTRYDVMVDDAQISCADVVKAAFEFAKDLEENEASGKESLLTREMQIGIATIRATKADKWKQLAESVRTPTAPPESARTESYY